MKKKVSRAEKLINLLVELSDESLDGILNNLKRLKPQTEKSYIQNIEQELNLSEDLELDEVIDSIIFYSYIRSYTKESVEELLDYLVKDEFFNEKTIKRKYKFKHFLKDSLNTNFITISSKIVRLIGDNQNHYENSFIYSDIRPIFKDGNELPEFSTIIHRLVIHLREKDKNYRMTLNLEDLKDLKDTIDRAIRKHENILKLIVKSGMVYVE